MILSTYQPYFAPFPGFFHKAHFSDIFVLLDTVQFPCGTTWISRNRFKNDQGTLWLTIPVWKKGLGLQNIDAIRICHEGRWVRKHLASLEHAYGNTPYYAEHADFIRETFASRFDRLVDFNMALIRYLIRHLIVETKLILLSETGIRQSGVGLLIELCHHFGASTYLAQRSSAQYLDQEVFQKANIELRFLKPPNPTYPQLWGEFIPNLSAFDLVFNCGPKAHDILFDH
jgi:hypothetical protein